MTIIQSIGVFCSVLLLGIVWQLRRKFQMTVTPEITEAERQGAGENAMYAELGRVK